MRLLKATSRGFGMGDPVAGPNSKRIPVRYPAGDAPAGTVNVKRTVASLPASTTISGGATRTHDVAEYFGSAASTNCGEPSRDRCQSEIEARTRTGSLPLLLTVIAWVVVPPGAAFNSSRSGVTSTEVCAVA